MSDDHSIPPLQSYKNYTIWIHDNGKDGGVFGPRWTSVMPITGKDAGAVMIRGREVIDAMRDSAVVVRAAG